MRLAADERKEKLVEVNKEKTCRVVDHRMRHPELLTCMSRVRRGMIATGEGKIIIPSTTDY